MHWVCRRCWCICSTTATEGQLELPWAALPLLAVALSGDNQDAGVLCSETPISAVFVGRRTCQPERPLWGWIEVDFWQASRLRRYEDQDEASAKMKLRKKFKTDATGSALFRSVRPLAAQFRRNVMLATSCPGCRAAHI